MMNNDQVQPFELTIIKEGKVAKANLKNILQVSSHDSLAPVLRRVAQFKDKQANGKESEYRKELNKNARKKIIPWKFAVDTIYHYYTKEVQIKVVSDGKCIWKNYE